MALIRVKRGTRTQLDAAAGGGQLHEGELYLVTDEDRLAVGTATGSYVDAAMPTLSQTWTAAQSFTSVTGDTDTIASATGTQAITTDGKDKLLTLTGNIDISLSAPAGATKAGSVFIFQQDATGSRTVTWNDTVIELGTQALNTAANGYSVWIVWTPDGGSMWFLTPGGTNA